MTRSVWLMSPLATGSDMGPAARGPPGAPVMGRPHVSHSGVPKGEQYGHQHFQHRPSDVVGNTNPASVQTQPSPTIPTNLVHCRQPPAAPGSESQHTCLSIQSHVPDNSETHCKHNLIQN